MPTLEQIQAKMKKLQAQAESLIAKRAQSVLNDIRSLMEKHGLTTGDIESHVGTKKRVGRPAGSTTKAATKKGTGKPALAVKSKLPAKYRNPKTGATWSGWARPPEWIKDVKDRSKFLIDPSADSAAGEASAVKVVVKKASAKKAATKKVAAKKGAARKAANKPTVTAAAEKVARTPKASAKAPAPSAKKSAVKKVATKKAARKVAAKKASSGARATNTPVQSSSEPVSAVSLAS
jgi:DNA-binding protein H-NS